MQVCGARTVSFRFESSPNSRERQITVLIGGTGSQFPACRLSRRTLNQMSEGPDQS